MQKTIGLTDVPGTMRAFAAALRNKALAKREQRNKQIEFKKPKKSKKKAKKQDESYIQNLYDLETNRSMTTLDET